MDGTMDSPKDRIDVVYTWVDDQWPGYREQLSHHARNAFDRDPSRTRDNIEIFRYSLRSLEANFDCLGTLHVLTCRPQVPKWLNTDHPRVRIIHHDAIMSPDALPTFNSLAIISHLHCLPGLSEQFLYVEDDIVMRSPFQRGDFFSETGETYIYPWKYTAPEWDSQTDTAKEKPWNLALAMSGKLVDQRYGKAKRDQISHLPLLINRGDWQRVMEAFGDAIAHTRGSKFRSPGNVDPASLYLWTLLAEGKAVLKDPEHSRRMSGYAPLEDFWPITLSALVKARLHGAKYITLNDNFGPNPSRVTGFLVRKHLQAWFPEPSSFERRD